MNVTKTVVYTIDRHEASNVVLLTLYATRFMKEANLGNERQHATTHINNIMHTSTEGRANLTSHNLT
jgi:predicted protein tyrosine phosphatase